MIKLDEEPEHEKETVIAKKGNTDDRIDEALLKARRIFICDTIDNDSAKDAIRKLWYLDLSQTGKPILVVINSPGGSVDAGFAIWDQIKMLNSPVTTLVTGLAASMGSLLTLAAPKGRRFATPLARFMMHQPSLHGLLRGQATDLDIQAKEMLKRRDMLIQIYAQEMNQNPEEMKKAIDRDNWMTASDAKKIGHIDKVVSSFKEIPA